MKGPDRPATRCAALAATTCLGLVPAALLAADGPVANAPGRKDAETAATAAVRQVETAYALADWARRTGDARALIIAARMLAQTGASEGPADEKGTLAGNGGKIPAAGKPTTPAWTSKFTARVINRTDKATRIRLITN